MTGLALLILLALAFANGANDNAKPVATLIGAGRTDARRGIRWGTAATALGAACALLAGTALVARFSSKGLLGPEVAARPDVQLAIAAAAALTVLFASRLGLPVSTTHALLGGMAGAGLAAGGLDLARLGGVFVLPLLASPLAAFLLTALLYPPAHALRRRLGLSRESCVCVGRAWVPVSALGPEGAGAAVAGGGTAVAVGTLARCRETYPGSFLGLSVDRVAGAAHWGSALLVSFGRGLQDGAKIAGIGLVLVGTGLAPAVALGVAAAMAAGGLLAARRVSRTVSARITTLHDGQGLLANLVSAALVLGASGAGLPVSTTHVTSGALMGLRPHASRPAVSWVGRILLSWLLTLPLAATLAAALLLAG